MRIGFDASRISVAERTGTENYSYELLKSMLRISGTQYFTLYSRQPLPQSLIVQGKSDNKIIGYPRLWTQIGLAIEMVLRQPDVLFIPAHTLPVLHRPSLKSVVTIHDLGAEYLPQYHKFPGKLYLNRATEYAASHATRLIAVSEFTKIDLVNRLGVDPDRIEVVYEGVNLEDLHPPTVDERERVARKYGLDRPYLLFIGTVQPRKNLARLIEAFSQVRDKKSLLVIAGKKGWLSDEIYEAPSRHGVVERVKFLGYINNDDRIGLIGGATGLVLPSLFEGFGLPLIESMAVGTPTMAANATSLPEVVGDAGLLVNPYDCKDMADGLTQLLGNEALKNQLRVRGLKRVQRFTWEQAAGKTLEILEKVANE